MAGSEDTHVGCLSPKVVQFSPQTDRQQQQAAVTNAIGSVNLEVTEDPVSKAEASLLTKSLRAEMPDKGHSHLDVLCADLKSPLYSTKYFKDLSLCPKLLEGLYGMGFKPSQIQEVALPILVDEPPRSLIAQSQSGTGKTAAFVLAMLTRVDGSKPYTQAICLCPTFELALQTRKVLEQMGKFLPTVTVANAINCKGYKLKQGEVIRDQIVVGTPGTVLNWNRKKALDLSKVFLFVLDEADVMISTQGYQDQVIWIHREVNPQCQMALFSATYGEKVMWFAGSFIPNSVNLLLEKEEQLPKNIKQFYVKCCNEEEKFQALANIYGTITIAQAIIFCRSLQSANWLASKMIMEGHAVGLLTGETGTEQRLVVLDRFREGKERVLISTVMVRGINVDQVNLVCNYDLPCDDQHRPDFDTYLHRIGRTGRFGTSGLALNLVDGEREFQNMLKIQEHFGHPILELLVDDPDAIESAVGD